MESKEETIQQNQPVSISVSPSTTGDAIEGALPTERYTQQQQQRRIPDNNDGDPQTAERLGLLRQREAMFAEISARGSIRHHAATSVTAQYINHLYQVRQDLAMILNWGPRTWKSYLNEAGKWVLAFPNSEARVVNFCAVLVMDYHKIHNAVDKLNELLYARDALDRYTYLNKLAVQLNEVIHESEKCVVATQRNSMGIAARVQRRSKPRRSRKPASTSKSHDHTPNSPTPLRRSSTVDEIKPEPDADAVKGSSNILIEDEYLPLLDQETLDSIKRWETDWGIVENGTWDPNYAPAEGREQRTVDKIEPEPNADAMNEWSHVLIKDAYLPAVNQDKVDSVESYEANWYSQNDNRDQN
ncbi:hypothetical protein F5B20DRAFT_589132 [Whalleya microplaca]|nr:hypothetical protein F5B20DRAFT_589132 [Whalleya microplaca]